MDYALVPLCPSVIGWVRVMCAGIIIICVACKAKRTLSWEEAAKVKDVVFCEKDGSPMVVFSAAIKPRRKGKR